GAENISRTYRPDWLFDPQHGSEELKRRYNVGSLDGFGFETGDAPLLGALGALIAYIAEVQPVALQSLRPPHIERAGNAMLLDEMTRRNLELIEPMRVDAARGRAATLIEVIDETQTPMGARLLRRWVLHPLIVADRIHERHDAVENLLEDPSMRRAVRAELKDVRDLERLAGRIGAGRAAPRDLRALQPSLARPPALRGALADAAASLRCVAAEGIDLLDDV